MPHFLMPLFAPASVALVGASSDPRKLGGRPLHNLLHYGYQGRIYPVNPGADMVQGVKSYRSIAELPEVPDQAIVVVPAPAVLPALQACAAKGIKLAQILSAGFAEVGGAGIELQRQVVELVRRTGLRVTGPNALGSVSPGDAFYGTFSSLIESLRPAPGPVGVVTQSGAFGSHVYAVAAQRGLGISRSIATGNEADIDVSTCIAALAEDPATRVICAALEGCRDGNRLRAALRACVKAGKPVIVMKVGSSDAGALAAATHTGSLAGVDAVFDAVFRECGAFRAGSIEEMIDIAYVCATGRLPVSDGLTVVTISGGIGVLMADAAACCGLPLPPINGETAGRLRAILPTVTGVNPIDTTAQVANVPGKLAELLEATQADSPAGTAILYLSHIGRTPDRFTELHAPLLALRKRHPGLLLVLCGTTVPEVRTWLEATGIPAFEDPSRAVAAIHGAVRLRLLGSSVIDPPQVRPMPGIDLAASVNEQAAKALLVRIGVPVLEERACATAEEAMAAAGALGYPAVLKILSPDIAHKTEVGGVLLNLGDAAAVQAGFVTVVDRVREAAPAARLQGVLVSPMRRDGVETIIGIQNDPVFGPMVMFGLGGVFVELFRDVAFASAPLSAEAARRLIASVRGAALLAGWRGAAPCDTDAVVDALVSVSMFAAAHADRLDSLEINPFMVGPQGGVALDALVVLRPGAVYPR